MKKFVASSAVLAVALALAVPAFAGGDHCGAMKGASTSAWAGACLQRAESGAVTVAQVAPGSPAAKAGLRSGDIVTAVNGVKLASGKECAASASCGAGSCSVGSKVTYTVQRDGARKDIAVRLVKMPADAASRWAAQDARYDATLAALVAPATK